MDIKKGSAKDDTFVIKYGDNNDIVISTSKGADTLHIKGLTDISKLKWTIDNNDVIITNTDNADCIRLQNYFKLNTKHSLKYLKLDNTNNLVILDNDFIKNAINITNETKIKKSTINGTSFDDIINADEYRLLLKNSANIPDTINHDRKGLTINGKNGNDTIIGTIYSDTLTGGTGRNTLVFEGEFGNDTVKLSKDEKITIDLTAYNLTNIDDLKFDNASKDLKITIPDGEDDKYGTIILQNVTKKDVVGSKGYIKFKLSDTNIVDIKDIDIFNVNVNNKAAKITGTRFSETIDASNYKVATGKNNKGVIINAGAGYNTIIGTNKFNDTIIGGNDGNNITAKNGNKTVTTGFGADYINITGEGNRTIKAGNGENTVIITGDGKNIITTGNDKDIIVVNSDTTNSINAGEGKNDITIKGSADSIIKTGNDNDTIRIEKGYELGNTEILAGAGTNSIIINNAGNWGDITLMEEKLKAKNNIIFTNDFEINPDDFEITKTKDDITIIDKNAVSTITLNKFFKNNNKNAKYSFKIGDNKYSVEDFINAVGGINIKGEGTIQGTQYSDRISVEGKKAATIYTGAGDDVVEYSEANRTIYFNEGDGHDIVQQGDGIDTLKFAKGTKISAEYIDGNLVINYGNKGDTVTLEYYSFANDSRKYYHIGNKKYAISSINGIGKSISIKNYKTSVTGTSDTDVITDERCDYDGKKYVTINAREGNDIIYALSDYVNAGDGNDYIHSEISYVYGGKGNDTFVDSSCWFGSVYYFKAGDGNDTMFSRSDNLLVFMDEDNIENLDISMDNKNFVVKYNGGKDSITWKIEPTFKQQSEWYGIQVGNQQYIYNQNGELCDTIYDVNSLNQTVLSWNNSKAGYDYFDESASSAKTIEQVMLTYANN